MFSRLLLAVCALLFTVAPVSAQEVNSLHKGKIGLGLDGIAGSPNFLVKYFVTDALAVQATVGYDANWPGGDTPAGMNKVNGSDFRLGLAGVYHLRFDRVSPYWGAQVLFRSVKESGFFAVVPDARTHLLVGAVLGADCFLHDRFSLGLQHTLNLDMTMKRDVPLQEKSTAVGTATLFTARFYFN